MTLTQRALACKHWAWWPGMCVRVSFTYDEVFVLPNYADMPLYISVLEEVDLRFGDTTWNYMELPADAQPYLEHPATMGCIAQLVRNVRDAPYATACFNSDLGCWEIPRLDVSGCTTEAEAWIVALENAP